MKMLYWANKYYIWKIKYIITADVSFNGSEGQVRRACGGGAGGATSWWELTVEVVKLELLFVEFELWTLLLFESGETENLMFK